MRRRPSLEDVIYSGFLSTLRLTLDVDPQSPVSSETAPWDARRAQRQNSHSTLVYVVGAANRRASGLDHGEVSLVVAPPAILSRD